MIDAAILCLYFGAILFVGWRVGRKSRTTEDFVVGGRQIPWWAVLASIVATEISAVTFIAVPGTGFAENLNYLQFGVGSILARFAVAFLFITAFYKLGCLTVYGYLGERFGPRTQTLGAVFFFCGRLLGASVRMLLAAFALALVFGWPLGPTLVLFTLVAMLYTAAGGIRAVVWTDMIQAAVFISAGMGMAYWLHLEVGWGSILSTAGEAGKLELFRWIPLGGELTQPLSWESLGAILSDAQWLPVAMLSGFLLTTASLGTDQDLAQRILTCRSPQRAKLSVVASGLVGIPVAALFLLVGVGLWAFYQGVGMEALPLVKGEIDPRGVLPHTIMEWLPVGLKGLLIAGLFAAAMSSVDSTLGALSSSALVDFYRPWRKRKHPDKAINQSTETLLSRLLVIIFGLLLGLLAWQMRNFGDALWLVFKLASIPAGAMLGIFFLGLLTKRGNDHYSLLAMMTGASLVALLVWLDSRGVSPVAWTWAAPLGMALTFLIGSLGRRREC